MILRRLGEAACRSYLLACERTRGAVLVDPLAGRVDADLALLGREGLRLEMVVDTHLHADHHSGGAALAARAGVPYALHGSTGCASVTERLRDGQVLRAGDLRVEVLHTPGHTPDSVTLRCGDALLTGDFLFLAQDGAGRLDLPGGDPGAHWDSLGRLASLEDGVRVLPGHDYAGLAESTLGAERRRNPRFQEVTREEYVAWQRAVAMPAPDWMLRVIAANLGTAEAHAAHHAEAAEAAPAPCPTGGAAGACATAPTGRVPLLAPREAWRRLSEGVPTGGERPFLLDVREPREYAAPSGRHAAGAVLVPLREVPRRAGEIPGGPDREVLVICRTGARSAQAAEWLIESGRRRVFSVAGGTDRWAAEGLPIEG